MTFTAIDFETATGYHPCSVGIVTVENGIIVDEIVTLIKPAGNHYSPYTIAVHGIYPRDTATAKNFLEVFPEIQKRLQNRIIVQGKRIKNSAISIDIDYPKLLLVF
jgi:DNA polymerase III subunit epsilon